MSKSEQTDKARATWFAYSPFGGEIILFATEREARAEAQRVLDDERDRAGDGWSEEVDQICWGRVHGEVVETSRRPRTKRDRFIDPICEDVVTYALVENVLLSPFVVAIIGFSVGIGLTLAVLT